MKLHDYMLKRLLVPNPQQLTKEERKYLLNTFEKVKKKPFPSITTQLKEAIKTRKIIDKAWFKILGQKEVTDDFLKEFYTSILTEIEIIDKLMRAL